MALQSFLPHLLLLISLLPCFISSSGAYKFYVGGREGWVSKPSENYKYNQWAERNRFQVNDTIYFKYTKGLDSVLVVNKNDYENCNTKNPIKKYEDGNSEFKFDRSGPFYFISGKNCNEGQKLIVVVLAIRPKQGSTPHPAPGAHSPAASPPTGSRPISPFPSPTTAPISAPSPLSQAPTSSSTLAPSSPSPTSQAPTGSPVQTPSTSPSPASDSPTGSPAPLSNSPTNSPAGAPSPFSPSPTYSVPSPSPASTVPTSSPVPSADSPTNSPAETPSVSTPSPTSLSPEQPTPTPAGTGSSPPTSSDQVSPPGKAIAATILPSSLLVSWFTVLVTMAILHKY